MNVMIRSTTRTAHSRDDQVHYYGDTIFGACHIVKVNQRRDVLIVVLQDGYSAKRDAQDNLWIETPDE